MLHDLAPGRREARCDRCDLASPAMQSAGDGEATRMLETAGWLVRGSATLCPRCRSIQRVIPALRFTCG